MKALALLVSLLFCASSALGEAKTVRILTIGNSFSRNATNHLDDLALAGGHTLIHTPLVIGGSSFQVHADKTKTEGKARLYTNGKDLVANLTADKWDYVTIQQASIKSHDFATYQPYAGILRDYITKHAPQAKLLIHQTWAYRKDDPRFTKPSETRASRRRRRRCIAASPPPTTSSPPSLARKSSRWAMRCSADTDATWGFKPVTRL
jgi:hypothetical protein